MTWHIDASQVTLPDSPAASWQELPPLQSALQEPAHEPEQLLADWHVKEQLPPDDEQPFAVEPCHVQLPL